MDSIIEYISVYYRDGHVNVVQEPRSVMLFADNKTDLIVTMTVTDNTLEETAKFIANILDVITELVNSNPDLQKQLEKEQGAEDNE